MTAQFNNKYFRYALLLLGIEIFIAMYVHDVIVRPYVGDFLVVILLYCMIKSLLDADPVGVALWVLGLENYPIANVIIGTSFEWIDLVAYTSGILTVLIAERRILK